MAEEKEINFNDMSEDRFAWAICRAKFEGIMDKFKDQSYTPHECEPRPDPKKSTQNDRLGWMLFAMFSEGVDFGFDLFHALQAGKPIEGDGEA